MTVEIIDVDQRSDEWWQARCGLPTASRFSDVIQKPGPRGGVPKGRQKYLWQLAAERVSGEPMDSYSNHHMERGQEREQEARELYEFLRDAPIEPIGFVKNGNCGASPDGAIGDAGLIEIKDCLGHIQVERLLAGTLPAEHKPQVQGQLMVSERQWLDFMSHSRGLPPLIVRVERDEEYIENLRGDVDEFCAELDALVEKLRAM